MKPIKLRAVHHPAPCLDRHYQKEVPVNHSHTRFAQDLDPQAHPLRARDQRGRLDLQVGTELAQPARREGVRHLYLISIH